jgi:hypothetical protein
MKIERYQVVNGLELAAGRVARFPTEDKLWGELYTAYKEAMPFLEGPHRKGRRFCGTLDERFAMGGYKGFFYEYLLLHNVESRQDGRAKVILYGMFAQKRIFSTQLIQCDIAIEEEIPIERLECIPEIFEKLQRT